MMRIAAIAVIGLLLLVGAASASQVTNVEVSYQDGSTVARIDVQGPIRFTHETEVPKDGRPDRVIVDILSATHELGAREFLQLPSCGITGVRSSQFSVTPEKIVRVVFDLTGSPLYQVNTDNNSIIVTFSNKGTKSFATWSTAAVVAAARAKAKPVLASKPATPATPKAQPTKPAKVTQQNKAIENDRLASLSAEPKKAPAKSTDRSFSGRTYSDQPTPAMPKPAPAKIAAADTKAKSEIPAKKVAAPAKPIKKTDVKSDAPKTTPAKAAVQKPAKKVSQPVPSPVPTSKAKEKSKLASSQPPAPKPAAKTIAQKPKPAAQKTTAVAQKPKPAAKGQQALAQKVGGKPAAKGSSPKVASNDAPAKPAAKPQPRSTARFRRKVPSAKIRGTMVAEFPKRLVIKYKTGGRRDPFGSLVDDTRTYDDPIEARVPNVEGLKLVGVLDSDGDNNRALFEDKSGFSYMLKTGDKVRNGYVLRVEADQVYFQIFEYGWSRTVALTME